MKNINKILLISTIISTTLIADNALSMPPMPPMPPGMMTPIMTPKVSKKKEDTNKTVTNTKNNKKEKIQNEIKENPCSLIPPMLYRLPTPLLDLVDRCQTKLLKPTKEIVKKRLIKNGYPNDINITKIEALKSANRLYKIDIQNQKSLICDEKIKVCFKSKPIFLAF